MIPAQIVAFTGVSDVSVCVSLVRHLLFYGEFGRIHFPIGCMWLFFFLFELTGDKCDIFGKGSQCVRMLLQSRIHVLDVSEAHIAIVVEIVQIEREPHLLGEVLIEEMVYVITVGSEG